MADLYINVRNPLEASNTKDFRAYFDKDAKSGLVPLQRPLLDASGNVVGHEPYKVDGKPVFVSPLVKEALEKAMEDRRLEVSTNPIDTIGERIYNAIMG